MSRCSRRTRHSLLLNQPDVSKEDVPKDDAPPNNEAPNSSSSKNNEPKPDPSAPTNLLRKDSEPDDEVSFDGPPTVSTSESISTTSPSGGRFVSNTFSYHTSDNESASSKSAVGQKVFRCEDEP